MPKEVINQFHFNRKANRKKVKTRTQYGAIEEYERQFKKSYGRMLGFTMEAILKRMHKMHKENLK